ncbi:MAG: hypothetical protein MI976_28580, partial [Pseudomonadales bacterium]|nr:hypothetical protein [Pseudomonadales bacterium]
KHIRILYDENDVIDDVDPSDLNRDVNATLRMFNFEAEIAALDTDGITYAVVGTNVVITRGDDSLSLPTRRRPLKGPNIFDFPQLPSDLRARVRFAEQTGTSQGGYFYFLGGNFDADTGEQIDIDTGIQMINVMTDFEREKLKRFDNTGNRPFANTVDNNVDSPWDDVVDALYHITRNPSGIDRDGIAGPDQELLVGLEQREGTNRLQHSVVDASVALTAAFATQPGYVVIGENLIAEPDGDDNPVSLEVYRVEDSLEAGSINVFRNHLNHLDTRLVVRHGLDFSGNSDDLLFEWYWTNAMGEEGGVPEFELDSENRPIGWLPLLTGTAREGAATYYLDSGKPLLSDGYIFVRYKGLATEADPTGDRWSDLAGVSVLPTEAPIPKKIEGWVKRVMSNIETYEQRYTDFNENEINSYSSMLVQAGPEYTSDVALTGEDGALNEVGLIELYQTILNYAIDLSIESGAVVDDDAVNTQLLYAASRIASLYMLIGNEAFSDAMDPTIGVISDGGTSYLQPSLFAFQNSLDSLIEEELGLLRGLDSKNPATGNRLLWNLVNTEAEAAYVQVYGITDTDGNGVENEAQANFPQGHGDAWGHYLSANKLYYSLARHPNYDWKPFTDTSTIVSGITGVLDYKDEQRFASSAAAKARTGARIVDLTFRNEYSHSPQAQWRGYKDNDDQRAWGMDGWARRAGQGAVLDWALANALLPYEDTTGTGIQKIDRKTTAAISEIPVALLEIDSIVSRADRGNNPFGVASDSIPFDIDASKLRDGESHFEQVYVRAKDAANNSVQLFNYANELTQEIRLGQISNAEFQQLEDEKERDFKDRLIELMGYPYSGNVGPGKIYPTGYNGPDLYQYRYIDSDLPDVAPSLISSITVEFPNLDDEDCESGCETSINNYLFNSDMSSNTNPDDNVGFINANGRLVLDFPVSSGSNYPYIKPNDSWGARPAPGKLQLQLSEMQLIQARINTTLAEQQALMANIEAEVNLLESIYDIRSDQIQTYDGLKDNYRALSGSLAAMRTLSNNLVLWGESIYRWAGIYHNTTSTSVGFSNDIGFIPRLGISATYSALTAGLITSSGLVSTAQFALQSGVEQAAFNRSIVAQKSGYPLEVQRQLTVIEKLMNEEIKYRYSLVELYQEFDNSQSVFQQLEAEAIRILGERIEFRKSVASRVTNDRYRDMTYRVFRNDALQKYRASFDLAAKYTYLAAKAFDYETGLLSDDGNGIDQSFYESLVRQRALGQYTDDGDPIAGVKGLSTPLARMASAFSSAESAFGGLDPLEQEFNFSLRQEAYRIVNGGQGADRWRRLLQNGIVSDLWNVPEFTEFCVPPGVSAEDGPLEGIVLRFGTTIHLDKNLFGWDKGSVDSTYSASYSATKFYRVGLHFDDYPDELVNTPYAYLVPVGTDFLRSPTDITQLRSYQVFDQAIPVPTDLTSGDTSYEEEGWIPGNDSVLTRWDRRRRFSDIPVSTDPVFDFDAVTTSGRLVGRSVWNTEWVLIIPGKSLAADGGLGIQTLINGDNANPTNEGISDIRLVFDTYSFPAQ